MIPRKLITFLVVLFATFYSLAQDNTKSQELVIENTFEKIGEWLEFNREFIEVSFLQIAPDRVTELLRTVVKDSLQYARFSISLGAKDSLHASASCLIEYMTDNQVTNIFMNQHNVKLLHDIHKLSSNSIELNLEAALSNIEAQTQLHFLGNDGYKFIMMDTEAKQKMDFSLELAPYLKREESHFFYQNLTELMSSNYSDLLVLKIVSNGYSVMEKDNPLKLLTVQVRPNYALCATDQRIIYLNVGNGRVITDLTERSWSPMIFD